MHRNALYRLKFILKSLLNLNLRSKQSPTSLLAPPIQTKEAQARMLEMKDKSTWLNQKSPSYRMIPENNISKLKGHYPFVDQGYPHCKKNIIANGYCLAISFISYSCKRIHRFASLNHKTILISKHHTHSQKCKLK